MAALSMTRRSANGHKIMIATAKTRMVLPFIALAAAGGAALVVAGRQIEQNPPVELNAATVSPQPSSPPASSPARDQRTAALDTARSAATDLAGALSGSPAATDKADGVPSFDVARLEPTGEAVIAGRAAPGATVELLRDGERHDSVIADQSGQFAMIPRPLPPGNYHLTLRSRAPDGTVTTSRQTLAVALDPTAKDGVMVALVAPDKPTVVLSTPTPAPATVAVEAVDVEPNGKIHVSGRAAPGATVRVYVSDGLAASLTAGADGRVSGTLSEPVKPGRHLVRLDQVEASSGKVLARAEVPLNVPDTVTTASIAPAIAAVKLPDAAPKRTQQLAAATPMLPAGTLSSAAAPKMGTITVSRGDNLWRISRRALGGGERYAIIYKANREQIRNPNLIYPGQVFVLPQR